MKIQKHVNFATKRSVLLYVMVLFINFLTVAMPAYCESENIVASPPLEITNITASGVIQPVILPASAAATITEAEIRHLRVFIVHSLMHLHQEFGYICWSMQASRRNLSENLHLAHLEQLAKYIEEVTTLADTINRLDSGSSIWPKLMKNLENMKKAVELMQKGQTTSVGSTPSGEIEKAGELVEEVGKELIGLFNEAVATASAAP